MGSPELRDRLLEDARRYDPAAHHRSLLEPYRDALLMWRAKYMSYEQISATLEKHGLIASPAAVGVYCRRTLTKDEILRERSRLLPGPGRRPSAAAPSSPGLSAAGKAGSGPTGRRGPRIARDDY